MRLTRRGWTVLGVVALAYLAAWLAGERSLNAVAAPLLAALLAGGVLVWRAEEPTVAYGPVQAGHPDTTDTLTVAVEGSGLVVLRQPFPDGIEAGDIDATMTPPATLEREVTRRERGVYRLETPDVSQRDPLGLVARQVSVDIDVEFVVYPRAYALAGGRLSRLLGETSAAERQEFDRLRQYAPGDPLRNIHWKSSAKRDDFLVMEFSPTRHTESITIAADATPGHADRMATAAATLALAALDADLSVELTLADGRRPPGHGPSHRETLLRELAGAGPGSLPEPVHEEADISIRADRDGPRVRIGETIEAFDALIGTGKRRSPEVSA